MQKEVSIIVGSLVMYENDGSPIIGVIIKEKPKGFVVFNDRGREIDLPSARLHLIDKKTSQFSTNNDRLTFLSTLKSKAESLTASVQLEDLWNVVSEAPSVYSEQDLSELAFSESTVEAKYAVRLALLKDKVFFKRERDGFEPRAATIVTQLLREQEEKRKKEELFERLNEVLKRRVKEPDIDISSELMPFITLLEDAAAHGDTLEGPKIKEVSSYLEKFGSWYHPPAQQQLDDRVFGLLKLVHHFNDDTNLSLIRHRPPLTWSSSTENEIAAFKIPDDINSTHKDYTTLPCFTIDDVSTRDMDDAISFEKNVDASAFILGIHITDVSSTISSTSKLDAEAKRRATSIYIPEKTIHMFPERISEEALSLKVEEIRPSVTLWCEVSLQGEIINTRFELTRIKSHRKYSYDEVDDLLNKNDETFQLINRIVKAFEQKRFQNGAIRVDKRDAMAFPKDGKVELIEIDEKSPARALVGELMILYNQKFAEFASQNRIPIPYRTQEKPDNASAPDVPPGPAYDQIIRGRLKRSLVKLSPSLHATLGLQFYTQATSPIRRYLDLVAQRQLREWIISKKPFFTEREIELIIEGLEEPLARATFISRESKRYWLLRYLEQRCKVDKKIKGTVVRVDMKNPYVELEEVYIQVPFRNNKAVKLGDVVTLKISKVDPRHDYVRLEEG